MTNLLPQEAGLTVNNVIYTYTAVKNTSDPFTVSVQNKDALGTGLIFQSTDNWSGLPGNTIAKNVPVNNIPIDRWGDGSIQTTGFGTVKNPVVIYNYRIDSCFEPTKDPTCPNYKPPKVNIPEVQLDSYDPSNPGLKYIQEEEEKSSPQLAENEKAKKAREKKLESARNGALTAEAAAMSADFFAMNNIPGFNNYSYTIPGGRYNDSVKLVDAKLPDNPKGRRASFAQQRLHTTMVESQYKQRKED